MLAYVLNKNIDSQKLLQDIQNLINNHPKESNDTLVLTIRVTNIQQDVVDDIPKLEYKPS